MTTTLEYFKTQASNPKKIAIAAVLFIMPCAMLMAIHKPKQTYIPYSSEIITHLTALQKQLTAMEHQITQSPHEVNLEPVKQQLSLLSARINQLQTINPEQLSQTQHSLSEQLNTLQTAVKHLDKTNTPITYLPSKDLPFQVLSLDSIQHIPVASVAYDFKVVPIEKDDSLASWTLVRVDYAKQQLEFENANKERVLITHDQIG